MPAPVQVKSNSKFYNVEIYNEEMAQVALQITICKEQIASLNSVLNSKSADLNTLNQQLLAMYIQQTGSFPP
jgi:hypothetical protein